MAEVNERSDVEFEKNSVDMLGDTVEVVMFPVEHEADAVTPFADVNCSLLFFYLDMTMSISQSAPTCLQACDAYMLPANHCVVRLPCSSRG